MDDIKQFLNDMEKEVATMGDKEKKLAAQIRLEDAMRTYSGEDKLISSLEILERIKNEPPQTKYHTGIGKLDEILDGLREEQLIVIAAPTKNGKTQMCMELTIRMPDTHPVWIPFEESATELIRKFHERGQEPPLFYSPQTMTGNTVFWIEKKVIEGRVKYDSKLFFIDHLHFIVPFSSDRLDTRIGQVMRDLKAIAKRNNVIIVLIAHLKKTSMTIAPDLEDLRDSSFIAQEADTVIMLWRETKREHGIVISDVTNLSVQANRRTGKVGNVSLVFTNGRYREVELNQTEEAAVKAEIVHDENW